MHRFRFLLPCLALLATLALAPAGVLAQTVYWNPTGSTTAQGGTGTWSTSTSAWNASDTPEATLSAWFNGFSAVFGGAGGTITNDSALTATNITFNADYTLTGSGSVSIGGTATVASGTLTLAGTGSQRLTGGGTLRIESGATVLSSISNGFSDSIFINVVGGTLHLTETQGLVNGSLQMTGGNVTASGSGALHLSSSIFSNESSDTATISAPLQIYSANNTPRIVSVSDGAAATDLAITGPISSFNNESVQFRKDGTGNLLLSGDNTYFGATLLTAGTLTLGSNTALGSSTLRFQGGTLSAEGTLNVSNGVRLDGASTVDISAGHALTFSGALNDSGGVHTLTKNGAGSLTLTTFNEYSGGTVLNAGTLVIGHDSALGGALTVNGGELQASGTRTVGNSILLNAGLALTGAGNLALTGIVSEGSGTRSLTQSGSGTVTLSGANSYAGGTFVSAGTFALGATDTILTTTALTVNGGTFHLGAFNQTANSVSLQSGAITGSGILTSVTAFDVQSGSASAVLAGANGLNKTTAGIATLSGVNTYTGGTSLADGVLIVGSDTALSSGTLTASGGTLQASGTRTIDNVITLAADLGVAGPDALTLSGIIGESGGPHGLAKSGAGTLTLNGANTYTGATVINDGILVIGTDTALGSGIVSGNGGALQASGTRVLANALTLGGAFAVSGASDLTLSGAIGETGGAQSLTKSGSGSVTLTGNNNYSGGTVLDAGTLIVGSNTALGSGTITLNAGDFHASGTRSLANAITLGANFTLTGADNLTLGGIIGETGDARSLTKTGASLLTLSGANTYSGGTFVTEGTLALGATNTLLTTGALTVNGGTFALGAFNQTASVVALHSGTITGTGTLTSTAAFDVRSGSVSAILAGSNGLVKTTADSVTLSAANTYIGGTSVNAGTLTLGVSDALLTTGALTISGGTFALGAFNQTASVAALHSGAITGTGTLTSTAAFDVRVGSISAILAGTNGLVKTTAGTVTLSAANTFSGTTTVNEGTLTLGHSLALQSSTLNTSGAGALSFGNLTSASLSGLSGSGTLALLNTAGTPAAVALTIGANNSSFAFGGTLSGAGSLRKSGTGAITLSGDNTYSGGTFLDTGALIVSSNTALGSGAVTLNGGELQASGTRSLANTITLGASATLSGTGNLTLAGAVGETGGPRSLTKNGGGSVTLSGTNNYSGGTTLGAGTLIAGSNSALGTGALTVNGGELQASGTRSLANAIALGADFTVSGASDLTLSGIIGETGGPRALAKSGTGSLTLTGLNTYSGGTSLSGGSLIFGATGALGSGTVTLASGDVGLFIANSSGSLTLPNAVVVSAGSGTATLGSIGGSSSVTYSGALTLNRATTLSSLSGSQTEFTGVISGNVGTLFVSGAQVRLSAANTFTGNVAIGDGVMLSLNHTEALPTNASVSTGASGILELQTHTTIGALSGASGSFVQASGSTLTVGSKNTDTTFAGTLRNLALTKTGSGTLTLSGANTYTGLTTINDGTLLVSGSLAKTTVNANGGMLALGSSLALKDAAVNLTAAGALSFGELTSASLSSLAGAGNLTLENTAATPAAVALTLGSTVFPYPDTTYSGALSGSGSLRMTGFGKLTLTGDNNYTGGTTLAGGTVTIGSDAAFGTGTLTFAGGRLWTSGSRSLSNAVNFGNNDFYLSDGSGPFNLTLTGNITGDASRIKLLNATLTLSGNNTYSGETVFESSTGIAGSDTAFGTGGVFVVDSALQFVGDRTLTNNFFLDRNVPFTAAGHVTLTGDFADEYYDYGNGGFLDKQGTGTLVLTGANSYIGSTTVSAGTLQFGKVNSLSTGDLNPLSAPWPIGTGSSTTANLIVQSGATAAFNVGGTDEFTAANLDTLKALGSSTGGFKSGSFLGLDTTNAAGGVFSYSSNIANPNGGTNVLGLVKLGTGTLTLSGSNTYSGGTTTSSGTLVVGSDTALGSGALTFNGGEFQSAGSRTLANAIALGAGFAVSGASDLTLTGIIGEIGGARALTKSGAGTLTLSGANTYSGGTFANEGTLALGATNALLTTGALTVNGGTFDLGAFNQTASSVALQSDAITGTGTLTSTAAFDLQSGSVSAVLAGTNGLNKTTAGTLTLSGANTYTGGTTISAGTLTLGSASTLASSTVALNGGALSFGSLTAATLGGLAGSGNLALDNATPAAVTLTVGANNADTTYAGNLSGAGSLVKTGTGTLEFTGLNSSGTYVPIVVDAGTVRFNSGGGTQYIGPLSGAGNITFDPGNLFISNSSNLSTTFSGDISGSSTGSNLYYRSYNSASLTLTGQIGPLIALRVDGPLTIAGGTATVQYFYTGGFGGPGPLVISAGAVVNVAFDGSVSAVDSGILAELKVTGAGTTLNVARTLDLPGFYNEVGLGSRLIVEAGATANIAKVLIGDAHDSNGDGYGVGSIVLSGTPGSRGALATGLIDTHYDARNRTITFDGGVLRATADTTSIIREASIYNMGPLTQATTLEAGGGFIDTNGYTVGLTQALTGVGGLTKQGLGTLTLSGANSYAGTTAIETGTLLVTANNALGTSAAGTTVAAGATLALQGGFNYTTGETLTLHGTGASGRNGALDNLTGNNAFAGLIILGSAAQVGASSGTTLTLSGGIGESGGPRTLTAAGAGTTILTGASTHTGGTTLASGILTVNTGGTLSSNTTPAPLLINGGTLNFNHTAQTLSQLSGTTGSLNLGAGHTLTVNQSTNTSFTGTLAGTGGLTKSGAGTLHLSNASYTGATLLSAGRLNLSGSIGALNVDAGGTFSPGNSPGLLIVNGDLTLAGITDMELSGLQRATTENSGSGTYDATNVFGSIAFGGTLTVTLLDSFSPLTGASFNLFDWTGTASGTFASLNLPTLATGLAWNTATLYSDGILGVSASAIPEPSTYAAIFGACALGFAAWRRRRSNSQSPVAAST